MNHLPPTTQNMIDQMLVEYPPYIQTAFTGFDWQEESVRIAAKHRLGPEQGERLLVETALLLLGIEEAQTFPQELMNHLGVSEEKAQDIALDIVERVVDGFQAFILEENRDVIQVMQNEMDDLSRQEHALELGEQGIEVESDVELGATMTTPQEAGEPTPDALYAEEDPYHESLFDTDEKESAASRVAPTPPPAPAPETPPVPEAPQGMIVPPPPPSPKDS